MFNVLFVLYSMSLGGGFNQAVNEAVNAAIDDVSIIIDINCIQCHGWKYDRVYVHAYRASILPSLLETATMMPAPSLLQALRGK